ncbi:MAG: hypothetical protein EB059_11125, partial [Alphaproteobacteria bacterium]|nr:hypothetical protein [Alphaproteobacteria bacterium]
MINNLQIAGVKQYEWSGPPQSTWHSEHQLMSRELMMRRVLRGHLVDVFYDTEANAKNANIAQFKSFFGIKLDLSARKLGELSTEAAFPPHIGIGFIPALIGGFSAEDMQRGLPTPLFSSAVYDFLRSCTRIDPIRAGARYVEERKAYEYVIPCADKDNIIVYLHPSGEKFQLPEDDPKGKWRKIYAYYHGYNSQDYDDVALAKMLAREGFANLFPSYVKSYNALRSDVLGLMRLLALVGDQGAKGFKTKSRFHHAFGLLAPSFRLGDMWSMQDLHALRERGVQDAVLDYQGRAFDALGAHQADR